MRMGIASMAELTRQQLCAELSVSESSIYRAEREGLPFTPVGKRTKRYDLDECKRWFRARGVQCQSGQTKEDGDTLPFKLMDAAFTELSRKVHLRAVPSKSKPPSESHLDDAA